MNLEMSLHWGIQSEKEQHNKEVMKKAFWRAKWFGKQTGGTFLISCCPTSIYFNKWTVFYHQHLPYNCSSFALISDALPFTELRRKGFEKEVGERKWRISSGTNHLKTPRSLEDCSKGLSSSCCFSCHLMECEEIILEWIKDDKIKQICRYLVTSECGAQKLCKLWRYQDN